MAKSKKNMIRWLPEAAAHDYRAAESYLQLIYSGDKASKLVTKLRKAAIGHFKAKDMFRASQLPLLGVRDSHVSADRKKISQGTRLSPLLLVRDKLNGKVVIADGYHRLCAVYSFDEDASIPCKII